DALQPVGPPVVADLGFAHVDLHRQVRCGFPEVIFCEGKTSEWVAGVVQQLVEAGQDCLATRVNAEQAEHLGRLYPHAEQDRIARTFWLPAPQATPRPAAGRVVVLTAGTSDLPVAREAVNTAKALGCEVDLLADVGVAGIHRLPRRPTKSLVLSPDFPDGSVISAWRLRLSPGKPSVADHYLPKRPRNPMGESQNDALRVDFDRQIKLEFHGSTVTSDAGLLAYRELDDVLGLTSTAATGLHDTRTGQNTQHSLLALLRQSIYSRLAGYEDVNDAERLCLDPALRTVVGGRAKEQTAASTSEMARFETETLSTKENLKFLMDCSGKWID